jgi:hypothetical protein
MFDGRAVAEGGVSSLSAVEGSGVNPSRAAMVVDDHAPGERPGADRFRLPILRTSAPAGPDRPTATVREVPGFGKADGHECAQKFCS